jgi:U3 small nucleolar RNA-associated protein 11
MSSLRNAVSRRPHRERAQPTARSKWGLLEKHKDYSLRAQDYNLKKKKISQLEAKAREKHPDEFAYGMVNKKQGKHGKGGEENQLSHDAVKLLKSQDQGYLRVAAARGRKELRKVEEQVGLDIPKGRKVVFEEGLSETRGKKRNSDGGVLRDLQINEVVSLDTLVTEDGQDEDMDGTEEVATAAKPKSKKALTAEKDASARLKAERKKRRRLQDLRVAKLEMLKKRQKEIMAAADVLELQRAKMARTVGGVNKNGVKFKIRERRR